MDAWPWTTGCGDVAGCVLQLRCTVGRTLGLGPKQLLASEVAVFPPLNNYNRNRVKENLPFASGACGCSLRLLLRVC